MAISDKLQKLRATRAQNIRNMVSEWTREDFADMRAAFETARELAVERNDALGISIVDEKISQLIEALESKSFTETATSTPFKPEVEL